MMSMYVVKNDKGEWLGWEAYQDDPEFICGGGSVWTVAKPKRWNVKVPHTTDELYWKRGNGNIGCAGAWENDEEIVRSRAFTLAEIEHYGLQDCEKVEVK